MIFRSMVAAAVWGFTVTAESPAVYIRNNSAGELSPRARAPRTRTASLWVASGIFLSTVIPVIGNYFRHVLIGVIQFKEIEVLSVPSSDSWSLRMIKKQTPMGTSVSKSDVYVHHCKKG